MAFNKNLVNKSISQITDKTEKQTQNNITKIVPISDIVDNELNLQFFRQQTDEEFQELKESIQDLGLLEPITVKYMGHNLGQKYKIISGHHRRKAMMELGFKEIPVYVLDIENEDDEELSIIHANTKTRKMTPLDYAKVIEIEKEILKRKNKEAGIRTDINETIANNLDISKSMVNKYQSLNKLIPELQEMIDTNELTVRKGSELAILPPTTQQLFLEMFKDNINSIESRVIQENKNKAKSEVEEYIKQLQEEKLEKEKLRKDIELLQDQKTKYAALEEKLKDSESYIDKLKSDLENTQDSKPKEMEILESELYKAETDKNKLQKEIENLKVELSKKQHIEKPSALNYIKSKNIPINTNEKQLLDVIENMDSQNIQAFITLMEKL